MVNKPRNDVIVIEGLENAIRAVQAYASLHDAYLPDCKFELTSDGNTFSGERVTTFHNLNLVVQQEGRLQEVPLTFKDLESIGFYGVSLIGDGFEKTIDGIEGDVHSLPYGSVAGSILFYSDKAGYRIQSKNFCGGDGSSSWHKADIYKGKLFRKHIDGCGIYKEPKGTQFYDFIKDKLFREFEVTETTLKYKDKKIPYDGQFNPSDLALYLLLEGNPNLYLVRNAEQLVRKVERTLDTAVTTIGRDLKRSKEQQIRLVLNDGREVNLSSKAYDILNSKEFQTTLKYLEQFYMQTKTQHTRLLNAIQEIFKQKPAAA